MSRSVTRPALAALVAVLAVVLAACGGGGGSTSSAGAGSSGKYASGLPVPGQKKGGTLKVLAATSFEHLDPGSSYYQLDYQVVFSTQRPLYYFQPQDPLHPVSDLAAGPPKVSSDGKTVTVKIKHGIKYGTVRNTPIKGKEVTTADIKYAMERGQNPHVANGYFGVYFPVKGLSGAKGGPISGIQTPDKYTLVLKLTKNFGATTAKALVMTITMPVPKSYAQQFDQKNPTTYDADPTVQAFTGPYMISQYSPGKSLTLVRNPEWNPKTDMRPAYVDRVQWTMGNDPNVLGRQVMSGTAVVNGDTPTAPVIKQFATQNPQQISFSPLGNRFVAMNTTKKPFSDINVRKAAAAALDRTAMQRVRGGPVVGVIATHFIPPAFPGFAQSGGLKGPGADYLAKPGGDLALAQSYMKKAGFSSGKANGETIVLVGDNTSPAKENALIVANSLERLGFKVKTNLVDHSVLYSKFCGVKSQLQKIDICANPGWLPDFADPYAMLYANFNGKSILPVNNVNYSLFNDSQINAEMDRASVVTDPAKRDAAWGKVDRDLVAKVPAIPWLWDNVSHIASPDVQGVVARWNADWDLSWMSLKSGQQ